MKVHWMDTTRGFRREQKMGTQKAGSTADEMEPRMDALMARLKAGPTVVPKAQR